MTIAVETLYDQLGRNYQVEHERNPGRQVAIDQALASLRPGSRVLDVGCGTGRPVSDCLASAGHHVFGIDISQTMIDLARQQVAMGEFTKVDMRDYQPSGTFDAIFASFSLFHLSHCETYSMMFKFCEWLKPGGLLIIGTSPSTGPDSGKTGRAYLDQICKQQVDIPFMGSSFVGTLYTTEGWRWLFESAGFSIEMDQVSPVNADLDQYFIRGRKSVTHPLMGPYPLPDSYRGPHPLSEGAWKPFVERLTRHEFDAVLGIVQGNQKVLDVGSGHGELPIAIAEQLGEAYSVEPNAARNSTLVGKSKDKNVHVYPGCAEKLPFPSRSFDAVVAMWILHYVDDLDKSLREMARMVDPASPNARIVICQGAPDNELVNLINDVCTPLSKKTKRPDHQGFLLHTAARVFSEVGFGDISLQRVNAYCNFPEEDLEERCERAADVLGRFWHQEDPNFEQMKEALIPAMKMHFAGRPHAIGDQGAILIARPSLNQC